MFTASFIGIGNRGGVYSKYFAQSKDVKIVAGCDVNYNRLIEFGNACNVERNNLFTNQEEFFKEKRSDVLVIATLDDLHCEQTIKALRLGYDVLLEKPVAPNMEQIEKIITAQKKYGGEVVICHNLRYTPFYQGIKKAITDGIIGDVLSFEQTENVAYHHFMQSFVRGNWRKAKETSPIILQKCCHDLDIMYWMIGKKCQSLSSYGTLAFYNKINRPEYATDKCIDCSDSKCAYNSLEFIMKYPGAMNSPKGEGVTKADIIQYLGKEENMYGKCIFNCDNDVCDRQIVNMTFEGGVIANLLVHGFKASRTDRTTKIYGTMGAIEGNIHSGKFTVYVFGQEPYVVDVNSQKIDESHLGGDAKLSFDYINYKNGKGRPIGLSMLEDSIYSHILAFTAEKSRDLDGKVLGV